MEKKIKGRQRGFTLIEFLVVAAVMWVVIGGLYTMLISGHDISDIGESQIDMQRNARNSMQRITQELRECYQVVSTSDYSIRMEGIQITEEELNPKVAGSYDVYSSDYSPWLSTSTSLPVIYKNGVIQSFSSGVTTVNDTAGEVTFNPVLLVIDSVKADYTYDAYLEYALSEADNTLRRKVIRISDGAELENEIVARYVANKNQSAPVPIFSQTGSLISVSLLIDREPAELPEVYRLDSDVRLRKK